MAGGGVHALGDIDLGDGTRLRHGERWDAGHDAVAAHPLFFAEDLAEATWQMRAGLRLQRIGRPPSAESPDGEA